LPPGVYPLSDTPKCLTPGTQPAKHSTSTQSVVSALSGTKPARAGTGASPASKPGTATDPRASTAKAREQEHAQQQAQQQAQAQAKAAGAKAAATTSDGTTIQGRVTGDGGAPLQGIEVELADPMADCFGCYYGYGFGATTDSNGNYSITDVQDGYYLILFFGETQGYLNGYLSKTDVFTSTMADAKTVTAAGSDLTGLDVQLGKAYYVQGKVTGTGGVALANVSVSAYQDDGSLYNARSFSDSLGNFSIPVLAGDYTLYLLDSKGAYLRGYWWNNLGSYNFTTDEGSSGTVSVTTSTVTGYNVRLGTGAFITGTVKDTAGSTMANVGVWVSTSGYRTQTVTTSTGTYSIDVLAGHSYRIEYSGLDTFIDAYYCSTCTGKATIDYSAGTDLEVDANVGNVNVTLPTGYLIRGTVTDKAGHGVPNLEVQPVGGDEGYGWQLTSADGSFVLDLDPGVFTVLVRGDSGHLGGYYCSTCTGKFTLDNKAAATITITNKDVTGINIQLPDGLRISGTVTGSGSPLTNIHVEADETDAPYYWCESDTDAAGHYALTVPAGTYTINFMGSSDYLAGYYGPTPGTHFVLDLNYATELPVTGNVDGINVAMTKGNHISGTITLPDDSPASDIEVNASGETNYGYAFSGFDGTYDILVPDDTYTISVVDLAGQYLDGYYDSTTGTAGFTLDSGSATALVVPADQTDINVKLQAGYHVSGHVQDYSGQSLTNIYVDLYNSSYDGFTFTDDTGDYQIAVPTGASATYTLHVNDYHGTYEDAYYCDTCLGNITPVMSSAGAIVVDGDDVPLHAMALGKPASAPGKVVAIAADGQALVSWTAPADNGGYPITGYLVTDISDSVGCHTNGELSCTVSGLTDGTSYTFSAYAETAAGGGFDSTLSDPVTPHALSTFFPIAPTRLLDTRLAAGSTNGHSGSLKAGIPVGVKITGRTDHTPTVPAGATAITVNVAAVNESTTSWLYIGPDPIVHPSTSTINFKKSDTTAYGSTVSLSGDGYAYMTVAAGTTDLVMDVTGYFLPGTSGSTYHPLPPKRLLDSRVKNGLSGKFKPNTPRQLTIRNRGGVPASATAITGNLAVTNTTGSWAAYIGPAAIAKPGASTINFVKGQTRANSLTVALSSSGTVWITFMGSGKSTIDVVFDVTGYYTAAGDTSGASYVPLTPNALLDTRFNNGHTGQIGANSPTAFNVWNRGNVPTSATGVTGIVSVFNQTSTWAVFVGPDPVAKPLVSSLNFLKGDNCSNGLTVALSAAGQLNVTYMGPAGAKTDVVVVVTGYFVATP
jgi:protocatechuate 3,4-dioxygenase beta subunit